MHDLVSFDPRELRRVLGTFVTGVTVVTTVDDQGRSYGVTANSFSSVSLDPPLVLWSQATKASSHSAFFNAERFAVNILAEDQSALSDRFARSSADKFAGVEIDVGQGGVPLLRDCSAWLECTVVSRVPGGDHTIYVGEVKAIRCSERRPLIFGNGQYLRATPHDLGGSNPAVGQKNVQLEATRLGAHAIAQLSRRFDECMALAVWGSQGPTITTWEPGSHPFSDSLPVGLILPVTSTATGTALAAHLPPAVVDRAVGRDRTPESPASWKCRLLQVRKRGLARQSLGTFYDSQIIINTLSAPVLDASGRAVLALTAVGAAPGFAAELDGPLALALRETAENLSHRLGHRSDASRLAEAR